MKQFFLLTILFALLSTTGVEAQDRLYSRAAETKAGPHSVKAAEAAAMDASIEKHFDERTGQATYVRKEVCPTSGKASYTAVEYCSRSGKFVNISPREKQCVKSKADCRAKGARATKISSGSAGKARCTTAQKAACAGAKAGNGKSSSAAKAKLVKNK